MSCWPVPPSCSPKEWCTCDTRTDCRRAQGRGRRLWLRVDERRRHPRPRQGRARAAWSRALPPGSRGCDGRRRRRGRRGRRGVLPVRGRTGQLARGPGGRRADDRCAVLRRVLQRLRPAALPGGPGPGGRAARAGGGRGRGAGAAAVRGVAGAAPARRRARPVRVAGQRPARAPWLGPRRRRRCRGDAPAGGHLRRRVRRGQRALLRVARAVPGSG